MWEIIGSIVPGASLNRLILFPFSYEFMKKKTSAYYMEDLVL